MTLWIVLTLYDIWHCLTLIGNFDTVDIYDTVNISYHFMTFVDTFWHVFYILLYFLTFFDFCLHIFDTLSHSFTLTCFNIFRFCNTFGMFLTLNVECFGVYKYLCDIVTVIVFEMELSVLRYCLNIQFWNIIFISVCGFNLDLKASLSISNY